MDLIFKTKEGGRMICPNCGGKLGVYRTVKNIRYRKCKSCGYRTKSYEKYRFKDEEFEELSENTKKRLANEEIVHEQNRT